ncbi:STAS domain-containing protein [Pseudobacillus wudalianchiensis]|uniref:Anti-anti-sigma factor n=1 Tax=Pseudobacillus wudalianchiensis TaxID=1743143 RepID=A0A1B9AC18_9BACI|nr:STAS domain-containing protein [Bacillus wudalianchiensis]OCA81386.1 anti-anti-sigma factor [Bacillus wudalianchiensis]
MTGISKVSAYLQEHAKELARDIVHTVVPKFETHVPEQEVEAAILVYTDFIAMLGEAILSKKGKVPEGLLEWSQKNGERTAAHGEKISIIVARYPYTRIVFVEKLTNASLKFGLATEEVTFINTQLNYMLDISMNETVLAFERVTAAIIKKARTEIMDLSAPIVPLRDGLAVLPLVGSINEERVQYLVEKAIPKMAEMRLRCLIIDFSGILQVDAMVEKHLLDVYHILGLLGIKAIATGIRPDLAQKLVNIGSDLSSIKTYATVRQAMEQIK